jgi:hypothetical protein
MSAQAAVKTDAPSPGPERKPVRIDPARVTEHGHQMRDWVIRMPADATLQDLNDPAVFARVQNDRSVSLARPDHLTIVAFDETWIATCYVAAATSTGVSITKPQVTHLPARDQGLFQDELYRVVWAGNGYEVRRKADGAKMTAPVANETLAIRDLKALYPRPAGDFRA